MELNIKKQTSLKFFLKTEIISSMFSNYSGIKLEINYKRKTGKFKYVEIKQNAPEQSRVKEEIKREKIS